MAFQQIDSFNELPTIDLLESLEAEALSTPESNPRLVRYYALFLYTFIISNDLIEARFLYRRIPGSLKSTDDATLEASKSILNTLWSKDYIRFYRLAAEELSRLAKISPNSIEKVALEEVTKQVRQRNYDIAVKAFESVQINVIAELLGLAIEQTAEFLASQNWSFNETDSSIVIPPVINDGMIMKGLISMVTVY
ncbi:hypothetical protein V1514DRAFT_330454 [Lipomyces japonicus]|uniref:uncharacterized protein n=1 Tax=Lipomyces japonicus TaxID=56871 RepID=UPI0034CEC618